MAKFRVDFVTNSSSSAFIIPKIYLSQNQVKALFKHLEVAAKLYHWDDEVVLGKRWDQWNIEESAYHVIGDTFMDNFDMHEFMRDIGINPEHAKWGEFLSDIEPSDSCNDEECYTMLDKILQEIEEEERDWE